MKIFNKPITANLRILSLENETIEDFEDTLDTEDPDADLDDVDDVDEEISIDNGNI